MSSFDHRACPYRASRAGVRGIPALHRGLNVGDRDGGDREAWAATQVTTRIDLTYVLPLRCDGEGHADHVDLREYLRRISALAEVIVVDGSPASTFASHRFEGVTHVPPDPRMACLNGKVAGVLTGLRMASHEHVVVADDDVRYDAAALRSVRHLLSHAELVVPQNVFQPMPWHARWDTARTLINRAAGTDYGGTLAVRRSTLMRAGGYDGDVLFENLELMRTVRAHGGRITIARHLVVPRRPPTFRTFLGQRVRQAFDDLAQPIRMLTFLSIGPAIAAGIRRRRSAAPVVAMVIVSIAVAEIGRRRSGGPVHYPFSASLMAPLWIAERALCIWFALGRRIMLGGIRYRDSRIRRAATPMRTLRLRARGSHSGAPTREACRT
jgi:glycosyl transferase family 21